MLFMAGSFIWPEVLFVFRNRVGYSPGTSHNQGICHSDFGHFNSKSHVDAPNPNFLVEMVLSKIVDIQLDAPGDGSDGCNCGDDIVATCPDAQVDQRVVRKVLNWKNCSDGLVVLVSSVGSSGVVVHGGWEEVGVVEVFGASYFLDILGCNYCSLSHEKRNGICQLIWNDVNAIGSIHIPSLEADPVNIWEINLPLSCSFFNDWSCHEVRTDEELGINDIVKVGIAVEGELEE